MNWLTNTWGTKLPEHGNYAYTRGRKLIVKHTHTHTYTHIKYIKLCICWCRQNFQDINNTLLLLLLLLPLLSPVCRVFTIKYLKQTMFLGYIVLQLFCIYNLCYLSWYFANCVLYFCLIIINSLNHSGFCIYSYIYIHTYIITHIYIYIYEVGNECWNIIYMNFRPEKFKCGVVNI